MFIDNSLQLYQACYIVLQPCISFGRIFHGVLNHKRLITTRKTTKAERFSTLIHGKILQHRIDHSNQETTIAVPLTLTHWASGFQPPFIIFVEPPSVLLTYDSGMWFVFCFFDSVLYYSSYWNMIPTISFLLPSRFLYISSGIKREFRWQNVTSLGSFR